MPEVAGRPQGRLERLSRERHERDLALTRQPGGHPKGFTFDEAAGARVCEFIETYCHHWKGEWAGQLVRLEPWQRWLVTVLFGWKRADGTRRFRKAWIEINRKNGKTFLAASLALYLLIGDKEAGAEVYCTATAEEQAQLVFRDAMLMAEASPELSTFVEHLRSKGGTLYCAALKSRMRPLSSESRTKDGLSPHGDIRDEVHEWNDPDLAAKLDTATGARRQPLTLKITTAGVYDPNALGWTDHEYSAQILEGLYEDDTLFVFIANCDDDENPILDPDDPRYGVPASWLKANPNLGVSAKVDKIREAVEEARNRPDKVNDVLRLHFGRWTQQVTRWLDVEAWKKSDPISGDAAFRASASREEALLGRECFGGLDGASKLDLMAFVLEFPDEDDVVHLVSRFWLPEATVDREMKKRSRRHYRDWVDKGWLVATPGEVIDYGWIRREINQLRERFKIKTIAFDPWNLTQLVTELGEEDGFEMVECGQGYKSMSAPSKDFEARIVARKVRHGGHPILRWCVGNAVKRTDPAGNIKVDKEKAKDKVDGVVASIMAHSRAILEHDGGGSYLGTGEGLLVL